MRHNNMKILAAVMALALSAGVAAAACGDEGSSKSDEVAQQQAGETNEPEGPAPGSEVQAPQSGAGSAEGSGDEPSSALPGDSEMPAEGEPSAGSSPDPSEPQDPATDPVDEVPVEPMASAEEPPSDTPTPEPDPVLKPPGPGDVPTAVALYGALPPPVEVDPTGAGGAGGTAGSDPETGAGGEMFATGGTRNDFPDVQPVYGAPISAEGADE